MRQLSSVEINRVKILTENSVELTLIEPTRTGLAKSIMDVTGPVRTYLKGKLVHDYDNQKQGQANKILINSYLVDDARLIPSIASLYRPVSKMGDPRIWFKSLPGYVTANDILGIIAFNNELYVLNITRIDVERLMKRKIVNPLQDLVAQIITVSNFVADELLVLLKKIAKLGPVPAMLKADTAIGRTLEKLLGIDINSSKKPDTS